MIEKRLRGLWEQLQGKKPHMPHFLAAMNLTGIRGIDGLRVTFEYPVSVIAGGNASGKSTLLFAAACAYRVPDAGVRDFVPSTLFPDFRPKLGTRIDEKSEVVIEFDFITPQGIRSMRWRRTKGWNRSFLGRKGASQPQRKVYLRTLSNLSNPSEVRGVLSMSRSGSIPHETALTPMQIAFAEQVLPFRYSEVVDLSGSSKSLLFAAQASGTAYSELHMAAGERAILRLSQEVAQLRGALILIDEVEAGLHPWVQQLLMMQLQQLALRNELQVIVTSHSPVVLDSVPPQGRIFLERNEAGGVSVRPPYHDIVQNALYGKSSSALNLLCEDEVAEGILCGIFDFLLPRLDVKAESIRIGRDTGADEFPLHAAAFRKFGQIDNCVFVLDGDKRYSSVVARIQKEASDNVPVLFLPGEDAPEVWVWRSLRSLMDSNALGLSQDDLKERMNRLDATYDSASGTPVEITKHKLHGLAEPLRRSAAEVARVVARRESEIHDSNVQPLIAGLETAVIKWRAE